MSTFVRQLVGETLERRFVFIISVMVTIALTAMVIVVIQHVHGQLWLDVGNRTMVRLTGFRHALAGKPLSWANSLLQRVNAYSTNHGSLMFIWLPDGAIHAGQQIQVGPITAEQLDTRRTPRELVIGDSVCLIWAVDVRLGAGRRGRLVIAHSRQHIQERLLSLLFKMLLIACALIILAYFIGRSLARSVLQPLNRFSGAMERVAQGEYPHENQREEIEDMGHWAETFNAMVTQLHEKHTLEKLLYEQEKMASVGLLAASVAHEIRNPLASINSLTQLIADRSAEDKKVQEYTGVVLQEVERLNTAIEQLLTFARPVPSSFTPIIVSEVLEGVLLLLKFEAQESNVVLQADIEVEGEVAVLGDPNQLKQVFINLVSNGIHALRGAESAEVHVSLCVDSESDRVEVIVADNGPGIPADHATRIFDPFFSTRQKGVGLGLAICKKIVNAHGGTIAFENRTARGGAIFTVTLPCGAEQTGESALPVVHEASPREID